MYNLEDYYNKGVDYSYIATIKAVAIIEILKEQLFCLRLINMQNEELLNLFEDIEYKIIQLKESIEDYKFN